MVSVSSDSTGKDTVAWSENSNTHPNCPAKGTVLAATMPVGVLPASQSVIMAKASYAYTSPIKFVMPSTLNFYRTFYLRPRKSETVMRVTG
jgi:Flp pilus assembly protein TadG